MVKFQFQEFQVCMTSSGTCDLHADLIKPKKKIIFTLPIHFLPPRLYVDEYTVLSSILILPPPPPLPGTLRLLTKH